MPHTPACRRTFYEALKKDGYKFHSKRKKNDGTEIEDVLVSPRSGLLPAEGSGGSSGSGSPSASSTPGPPVPAPAPPAEQEHNPDDYAHLLGMVGKSASVGPEHDTHVSQHEFTSIQKQNKNCIKNKKQKQKLKGIM